MTRGGQWKWITWVLLGLLAAFAHMSAFGSPAATKGTRIGILVVGTRQDATSITQGGALMAKLHAMRERKGYSKQQLGLFVWDYSSTMEVAATAARFGITPQDLAFAGVVRVGSDNRPLAVLSRHNRVQDVDAVAQAVFAEAESAMGLAKRTSAAPLSHQPSPSTRTADARAAAVNNRQIGGTSDIHLNADGSGDFPSLIRALKAAPDGATIHLSAGTFTLTESFVIFEKSIDLKGEGMDRTVIDCQSGRLLFQDAKDPVVSAKGTGRHLEVSDVTFECKKHECPLSIVMGNFEIRGCRFRGASSGSQPAVSGAGLWVQAGQGSVDGCEFVGNQTGLWISGPAGLTGTVTISGNKCEDNSGGMAILGDAHPTVRGNTCSDNHNLGIVVSERSAPLLEQNHCLNNAQAGVFVDSTGQTVIQANECRSNNGTGIFVSGKAAPTIVGNSCIANQHCGIAFASPAHGIARNNICTDNKGFGICVQVGAQPTLENNTLSGNAMGEVGH